MVSPCLSSLMRRAALNSLRKLKLMKLFYATEGENSQLHQTHDTCTTSLYQTQKPKTTAGGREYKERERERRGGEGEKHNLLQTKWLLVDTSTNEGKTEKKSKDKEKMKEGGKREEIKEIIIQRV